MPQGPGAASRGSTGHDQTYNLTNRDSTRLTTLLGSCPELRAAAELVRSFAAITTQRHGQRLGKWLTSAEQADLPGINRFVDGVTSDLDAVTAGLSLPFSSGPVEGNVNRIKMWTAGYTNVIAGSFLRDYPDYLSFRKLLALPRAVFLVDLMVDKDVRDGRRVTRPKQTTQQWRDMVDLIPEDLTIRRATDADYRYIGIDTTRLDVPETVRRITHAIPEIYAR